MINFFTYFKIVYITNFKVIYILCLRHILNQYVCTNSVFLQNFDMKFVYIVQNVANRIFWVKCFYKY